MKNPRCLLRLLFVLVLLAGSVLAQATSISTMPPGEKFTSTDAGFTIALPREPTKITVNNDPKERGVSYKWLFTEGGVVIAFGEYLDGTSVTTGVQRAVYLTGFKNGLIKGDGVKLISERPLRIGMYRGASYAITLNGQKAQMQVLAWGRKHYSISAIASGSASVHEKEIFKALASFKLTAAK